ncbi:MAG: hypothetical protein SW833_05605 [Cyanobacteriota bacterium]|nr:hypothetical protein [Cyanobacteriota bacterium]
MQDIRNGEMRARHQGGRDEDAIASYLITKSPLLAQQIAPP